ncbi:MULTISPECIES: NAD-dependent epimerase/dehydratase family protein [unclassified Modestobacter]
MARHVVVGKGPVGSTTARLLAEQGHEVVVLSRSGGPGTDAVRHVAVDAADAEALVRAVGRADVLYNAVNPPSYTTWTRDWPPMATALLTAAERSGAGLVIMGNLYGYGRPSGPMKPEMPLAATDVKGRLRARMWADALAAQQAGRLRATEARASDFVGPGVPAAQSHLIRQLDTLRRGRRAWVIGDPDVPRSWTNVPDAAATLITLGADDRSWGRAWHVPSSAPRSQRQALSDLARAMGAPPAKVTGTPWPVLRAAGLAVPLMREIAAIRHQWDQEFVLDATGTTDTFGLTATPWDDVVRATVQSWSAARDGAAGTGVGARG